MLDSPVLNVVIGLIFVYLLYSLLATIIKEMIASLCSLRANMLGLAIARMLEDGGSKTIIWVDIANFLKNFFLSFWKRIVWSKQSNPSTLSEAFFDNPGVKYLADGKKNSKPSYLEPAVFSKTIVDVLKGNVSPDINTIAQIKSIVSTGKITFKKKEIIIQPETQTYLLSLISDANNDIDKFKALLEQWFNNMMDRASGWYKRQAQKILMVIGLLMAVSFNVDTIAIVSKLSKDPKAADRLAGIATAYIKDPKSAKLLDSVTTLTCDTCSIPYKQLKQFYSSNQKDITDANQVLALGWTFPATATTCCKIESVICQSAHAKKILGFLLTAIAISLGAPFWFDLLSKIVNLRNSGSKPEEQPASAGGSSGNNSSEATPPKIVG